VKLSDRIEQSKAETREKGPAPFQSTARNRGARDVATVDDPLLRLKRRAQESLLERVGPTLFDAALTQQQLETLVVQELATLIKEQGIPLTLDEQQHLVSAITDEVLGYGPIEEYLDDDTVTEIMVNGLDGIFVERDGLLHETDSRFLSDEHVMRVIDRIVGQVGRRVDELSPMVDARLADGSRVNAIIPPLAIDGPVLTIRKFSTRAFTLDDLVELGTMSHELCDFLAACVEGRMNILVSGGTGTGKTTMLNVLSAMIPETERIVTVEDAAELRLEQRHVIRLEGRPANVEGRGQISARDLVRNALRMRPDRIIVGEVRGAEALDMLQAMNTGHDGSLSTLHANSPRDALSRVETMVLMSGIDYPLRAIREQVASAIDLLVHVARMRDGSRRIVRVAEVQGMEHEVITLCDLFEFNYAHQPEANGGEVGSIRSTGIRPHFATRLQDVGIEMPPDLFGQN
jgi:pilus assembly protein CpaF